MSQTRLGKGDASDALMVRETSRGLSPSLTHATLRAAIPRVGALECGVTSLLAACMALSTGVACAQQAAAPWLPGQPKVPLGAPAPAPAYRPIAWSALSPPGWDAMKGFAAADLKKLDDADPAATELLKKLRQHWDNAPVNLQLVGQPIRLSGYVVPLEQNAEGLTEFLLVPYYGACIHSPPPPANQVVQVLPRSVAKGIKSMDTVSVSGVLRYARNDSYMGTSSWRLEAVSVEPYVETRPGVVAPR